MIRRVASCLAGSALLIAVAAAAPDALEIYFIDTEGGQATLLVAPSGAAMLIDAGFMGLDTPNPDKETGRDPARIAAVAQTAGVKAIDTLLMTHFHGDHVGGAARLAELLPIRTFIDHGPAVQAVPQLKQSVGAYSEYWAAAFAKGRHLTVAAGDRIDVPGLEVTVVQASATATPRAGSPNPHCNGLERRMDDNPENTASIGVVIAYGQFRFANFGDLPWNEELELLCPSNRVG